jgi:hypothetical protein
MGVFVRVSFCVFMEFTTQGGPFHVLQISAHLHTSPKRIKRIKGVNLGIRRKPPAWGEAFGSHFLMLSSKALAARGVEEGT